MNLNVQIYLGLFGITHDHFHNKFILSHNVKCYPAHQAIKLCVKETVMAEFDSNLIIILSMPNIYFAIPTISTIFDFCVLNFIFNWLTFDICQISHFWSYLFGTTQRHHISNLFAQYTVIHRKIQQLSSKTKILIFSE